MNERKGREWEAIHTKQFWNQPVSFIWKESLSFRVTTDAVVIPRVQAAKDLF